MERNYRPVPIIWEVRIELMRSPYKDVVIMRCNSTFCVVLAPSIFSACRCPNKRTAKRVGRLSRAFSPSVNDTIMPGCEKSLKLYGRPFLLLDCLTVSSTLQRGSNLSAIRNGGLQRVLTHNGLCYKRRHVQERSLKPHIIEAIAAHSHMSELIVGQC